jgi:DNA-binding SARP family transcriptional activator
MPNNDRSAAGRNSGGTFWLTALGGCSLACPSGAPPILGSGKPIALLVYLHCSPGHTASREHLLDLLWTDLEPFAARHALRQAVWYLRQRLGDDAILTADGTLQLGASLDSDRQAFLEAVERVDLERAVELYAGDFLPRFAVPGGAEFERWAELERYRLRLVFLRTAEVVVRRMLATGRARGAVALATRARDADHHRESVWRLLIEVLHSAGDQLRAEVEGDALEQLLATEGREPELATRRLLERLRSREVMGEDERSDRRLVAELVGREREFGAIVRAWEIACRGRGRQHIHVEGRSGLGKTRLLRDTHARLRVLGARVVRVRATPAGRDVAYTLASELARAVAPLGGSAAVSPAAAAALVGLNPSLSSRYAVPPDPSVGDEALRRRTIALTEMVLAVTEEGPLAVLVDDLHWADDESRTMLLELVEKTRGAHMLFLTAARPGPASRPFGDQATLLSPAPLSALEIGALVASLGALPSDASWTTDFATRLHDSTAGIPLLVIESLQLLLEQGILRLDERSWTCESETALRDELEAGGALGRRLERLPPPLRRLLIALAAGGASIPETALERLGEAPETTRADLLSLEARGLARRSGTVWSPGHDEVAEAAWNSATDGERRGADVALGRALRAVASEDAAWLWRAGRHLARAGAWGDLVVAFRLLVSRLRRARDSRDPPQLAREFLRDDHAPEVVQRLVRALPLRHRLSRRDARAAVVAGVLLLAAGTATLATVMAQANGVPPDARLLLLTRTRAGGHAVRTVPVHAANWDPAVPLDVGRDGKEVLSLPRAWGVVDIAPQPGGKAWVIVRLVPDSTGLDLWLLKDDLDTRRLTAERGEDLEPDWSPDGSEIAFETERWSGGAWRDIAVLNVTTGDVRRLTHGEWDATRPMWSPNGQEVAFQRSRRGVAESRVCVQTADGVQERCYSPNGLMTARPLAWHDGGQLVISGERHDSLVVALLDLTSGAMVPLRQHPAGTHGPLSISRDGRWVAIRGAVASAAGHWSVGLFDRTLAHRELILADADVEAIQAVWQVPIDGTWR